MGGWAQAITQGLGRVGNEITGAKDLQLEEQAKKLQLLMAQQQLGALTERLGIEKAQLGLEQQREKRLSASEQFEEAQRKLPQFKGFQVVGTRGVALQQMPDGTLKTTEFDLTNPADASMVKMAQNLISSVQDPAKRQRMSDEFGMHAQQGDVKGGLTALQQEVAKEETETAADKRETRREQFSKEQQQRGFEHQEKMLDLRQQAKLTGLKAASVQGLSVLHASLFGQGGTPGLDSSLAPLDSKLSRAKLITAHVGRMANPDEWTLTSLMKAGVYDSMNPAEQNYARQLARAVSAIQGLRQITGLPRSTAALMQSYIMELPDPVSTPSSKAGAAKLALIEREIRAAMMPDALARAMLAEDAIGAPTDQLNLDNLPAPGE